MNLLTDIEAITRPRDDWPRTRLLACLTLGTACMYFSLPGLNKAKVQVVERFSPNVAKHTLLPFLPGDVKRIMDFGDSPFLLPPFNATDYAKSCINCHLLQSLLTTFLVARSPGV